MQVCNRCNIRIHGNKKACPLCGGPLTGEPEENVYPVFRRKMAKLTVIRMSLFLLVAFLAAITIMSIWLREPFSWIPLALISAIVAFADICVTVYFRTNPIKTITWQAYIGMLICVLVDGFTGWYGWSVIWVLPCAFVGMMIATMAVGMGLHMMLQDFVLYLLFNAGLSFVQVIPIRMHANPFDLPALLSMGTCAVLFLGILIFRWRDFKSASCRYFNM